QNLILTRKGKVKILDFGLARLREDQSDAGPATQNIVVGTPDFLSPEQARDSHTVDIRADIYALGCTLYFLLTRRVPFPCNSSFEKMLAHASTMPEPVDSFRSDVPQELKAILATMIAKRAEDRFQTPQEVVAALAPFAKLTTAGSSAIDTPMTSPRPPEVAPLDENPDADAATAVLVFKPQQQRRRTKNGRANKPSWLPIGLAVGALVAACLLVFFLLRDPSDPHKSKAAESKTEVAKSRPQDQVAKQFNSTPTQPKLKEKLPATQPEEVNPPEVKFQPPEGKFPPDGKFPKFDGKKGFPPPLREVRWEDAKYHVLIAVAKNGAWFDDYAPLRGNLQQQGIHVSVVSSEWGTITPQYNRGPRGMELEAKFAFTSEFDFREYDAIIVIGGQVDTFNPQFTAKKDWMKEGKQDPAKMIGVKLQKMLDANKLVAAIGSGQAVLVWHNILKDGMKAARVGHDEEYELGMKYPKIKWNDSQGVVRDGNVITAGGAPDADRLAEEIVRALEGTKK
ncbi:MAG: DJ-1/PfpI family protein, partial [Planctomycetes bacterium]|nr:DJ-1/PfpI family protein [Planctomycetota bacterium]